jgi:hypothetical protein
MFEFLKLASKSPWGVFFYLGVIFIVAAVTGGFAFKTQYTTINQTFIPFLFVLGVVLIAYTMYREWADSKPRPQAPSKPNPADYKVEVTKPKPGEKLSCPTGSIVIEGKVKRDPKLDGLDFWYIPSGTSRLFPQRISVDIDKKWKIEHRLGEYKAGDHRVFKFYVVGKNAQALYMAYKGINDARQIPGKDYEPLHVLTDDVYDCLEHTVFLEK